MRDEESLPAERIILLEGSTRLLPDLVEAHSELLLAHHEAVRGALAAHGALEVRTHDSFSAFSWKRVAVSAAVDRQRALTSLGAAGPDGARTGDVIVSADD